jgi:hypothetical protein
MACLSEKGVHGNFCTKQCCTTLLRSFSGKKNNPRDLIRAVDFGRLLFFFFSCYVSLALFFLSLSLPAFFYSLLLLFSVVRKFGISQKGL